ncbi:MAG: SPFH domain-containing protein [Helicobacteraceae bacterium]|jgi:membrane protease subunit (stomatin/prohibitin family)|nr:SPFH domain-containing protein [Helicobacteraceae bacterium]
MIGFMNSQFIEVIESVTPDPNLLMWKFRDEICEIQNGAKLTVRESQQALFLCEGRIADVFQSGLHSLATENIPIFSRLKGWKYGFKSPYKADIYFFNTNQFINNKWGTPSPILMRDSEFGNARVRAYGSFDIRISDAALFFKEYAGTYKQLTIFELQRQLRDFIAPKFGEILSSEKIALMEVAGNITELSKKIEPLISPYFAQMGLTLTQFIITSVTLPDEVLAHIDSLTNMNMVSDMKRFSEFQTAKAIGENKSALNDAAAQGAALNLILARAQANDKQEDIAAKLTRLKTLFENALIDEAEYKSKKAQILAEFDV